MIKTIFKSTIILALSALLTVFLAACGGGGSRGGGGISYSGSTSPAAIDSGNAVDIATGAYQGGSTGSALGLGAITTENNKQLRQGTLVLSQIIERSVRRLDMASWYHGIASGATRSYSDTSNGDCGGSVSFTISYDDSNGDFSGSATFSNYCDQGSALSGRMSFSGILDTVSGDILQLDCTFSSLTATSGSDSFTLHGTISFNFSGSTASAVFNALLRNNTLSKVYKIENFNITRSEGTGYTDISISGTFYNPDHGYVVISTTAPLRTNTGDDWPNQGGLLCTGNTGAGGGSTSARLTALSATNYQVEADTNGDGTFDYDSGPLLWAEL